VFSPRAVGRQGRSTGLPSILPTVELSPTSFVLSLSISWTAQPQYKLGAEPSQGAKNRGVPDTFRSDTFGLDHTASLPGLFVGTQGRA
jgi:hypothetical protein